MLEKTIAIGDKQVKFRSSATIPRLYRMKFKRDIFKDLSRLESSYKGNSDDGSSFEIEDLEIFENVAYIMPPLRTGWMNSRCSPSTRCFLKSSNSGA